MNNKTFSTSRTKDSKHPKKDRHRSTKAPEELNWIDRELKRLFQ